MIPYILIFTTFKLSMNTPKTTLTLQTLALPFLALAAFTAFCYYASPIAIPIVISISLAYILSPFVLLLKKLKIPHIIAVLTVLVVALLVVGAIGYLLFIQANYLLADLPSYWQGFLNFLENLKAKLDSQTIFSTEAFDLKSLEFKDFSGITKYLAKGIGSFLTLILESILIFFLVLFILNDQEMIKSKLILALGRFESSDKGRILNEINQQIKNFLWVKFLLTLGLAVTLTLGLLLIGVNYAYIWGPLAALADLIPFIGPVMGAIPPLIVAGIQFQAFMPVLWVLILFIVIQNIQSNLIQPKIIGESVNLRPLAVLISSMYWGWLWGAIGVVLAVPITASVKVICDHIDSLEPIGILLGGKKDLPKR